MPQETVAEIDLTQLVENARAIARKIAPARLIPVVKADAYGHGAVQVTRRLAQEGYPLFAVARLEEALELRESGIDTPILIFGRLFPDQFAIAAAADFRISIFGETDLDWVEKSALPRPLRAHLKIDTGMGRVGLPAGRHGPCVARLAGSDSISWEGVYSHFATSDESDKTYADQQLVRFKAVLDTLPVDDQRPVLIHMANSGAVLDLPESGFDAARVGILLYGHYPTSQTSRSIRVQQVMRLKTRVAHVRHLPAGHPISYGRRWITPADTRIGVLPIGYADGLPRSLTNRGEVLIRGRRYPMVGTVTMDATMVHLGDDPVAVGDEAVVWGRCGDECIEALEVAERIGTIPYELTCSVSKRVRRVYSGGITEGIDSRRDGSDGAGR